MVWRAEKIKEVIQSPKGRNVVTFLLFLAIASVLWIVTSLNEEMTHDFRSKVEFVHVPDSITRISPLPDVINVSVKARGTSLLRYIFSDNLKMSIDYRTYVSGNKFYMKEAGLKAFFRSKLGGGVQVNSVSPDSLRIFFTANRPVEMPVRVDAKVEPGPQFAIIGKVRSLTDSVRLYAIDMSKVRQNYVSTMPIVLNDLREPRTLRVPLSVPDGCRAIPDSVDVRVDVEPLISKSRMVDITPRNLPAGAKLITHPTQVEVYYMVPISVYKQTDSDPRFVVTADYNSINPASGKIAVSLERAPADFLNVFLETDSLSYILEQ